VEERVYRHASESPSTRDGRDASFLLVAGSFVVVDCFATAPASLTAASSCIPPQNSSVEVFATLLKTTFMQQFFCEWLQAVVYYNYGIDHGLWLHLVHLNNVGVVA
jgi:hypothetical protein